jgi:hypothetical protein
MHREPSLKRPPRLSDLGYEKRLGEFSDREQSGRPIPSPSTNRLYFMPQVLIQRYSERDVADVESYVRDAVGQISQTLASDEREQLVARGVVLVRRIASALPPETSLADVLQGRLGNALAVYRWRGARLHGHARIAPRHAA